MTLVGSLGRDPDLPARIVSWFDPAHFSVEVRPAEALDRERVLKSDASGAVHVWVTLRDASTARLYFTTTTRGSPSYLLRDLSLARGLDEMAAERIAEVLHLSAVALTLGEAKSERSELEATLKREPLSARDSGERTRSAPPARGNPGGVHAEYGVGYSASLRGEEGLWHGPRVSARGIFSGFFGLEALAALTWPHTLERRNVSLRLEGADFGAALAARLALSRNVAGEAFAGALLEVVHYVPTRALDPNLALGSSGTELRPAARAGVSVAFGRRCPRFALIAEAGVPLRRSDYNVVTAAARERIARSAAAFATFAVELRL